MDVRSALVPNSESSKLVEPGKGPLHHPAKPSEPASMFRAAFRQDRLHASVPQVPPVRLGVVGPVSHDADGLLSRAPELPPYRRDRLDQGDQLGDIVPVGGGEDRRERDPLGVRNDVVLRPQFPSIRRIRARFRPPKTARTLALSTTARDQSILSASRSFTSIARCTFSQTPASCQALRYRQQVIPDPQPISCGNISQGMPLLNTNSMPANTLRRSMGFRPGCLNLRGLGSGNSGSTTSHSSSETSSAAMCIPPFAKALHMTSAILQRSLSHSVRGS